MKFPKQDPGEGRRGITTWSNAKVPGGEWFNCWKAGDAVWVWCHWKEEQSRSVPCYFELTKGKLECPYCTRPRSFWNGYVPLYDDNGKPVIVVVKEYQRAQVDAIKLHKPCRAARRKGGGQPITLAKSDWSRDYVPTCEERRGPADIESALLVMWKEPELVRYFAQLDVPAPTVKELIREATEKRAEADEAAKELIRRRDEWLKVRAGGPGDTPVSLDESLPSVRSPEVNGVHKPKPK